MPVPTVLLQPVATLVDEAIGRLAAVVDYVDRRQEEPGRRADDVRLPKVIIVDRPVTGFGAVVDMIGAICRVDVEGLGLLQCRVIRSDSKAFVLQPVEFDTDRVARMKADAASMYRGLDEEDDGV